MTNLQLSFWTLQETERHNTVTERETRRHNIATEGIQAGYNAIVDAHYVRQDKLAQQKEDYYEQVEAPVNRAVALKNAQTNARNASTNAQNAATNSRVATIRQAQQGLAVDQFIFTMKDVNRKFAETQRMNDFTITSGWVSTVASAFANVGRGVDSFAHAFSAGKKVVESQPSSSDSSGSKDKSKRRITITGWLFN